MTMDVIYYVYQGEFEMSKFNQSKLSCAIAALSITSLAGAAGLDRSG